MWFRKIPLSKTRKRSMKKIRRDTFQKYIKIWLLGFLGFGCFIVLLIYVSYIRPLPPISKLEEVDISSSSIVYDREWNELYTFAGDEKRTYFPYENISKYMIHAITSGEDKTFFENAWIDIKWLFRAVIYRVIGRNDRIEGTSTISQQLIRNTFLTNERSIERKIKEMYLSIAMNNSYSKEKILELYLNKISFWSNAFWVEQASRTFFGKSIADINVLEWSILASIPKWPTYYSPYNYYDRLVGYLYTYPKNDVNTIVKLIKPSELEENKEITDTFLEFLSGITAKRIWQNGIILCNLNKDFFKRNISVDRDGCTTIAYSQLLTFLNDIRIISGENSLEYQTGRKDFILGRMLEDERIEFEQYQQALIASIGFEFQQYRENIRAPHFVFYIKEYLESKYWVGILEKDGLKIYTTLHPDLQKKAEELVKEQALSNNSRFEANNAALISIDNKTGDIVAYVWGSDYFNKEIDGNVNVLNAKRQPWSSFKPFVYALAMDKKEIGPQTPIYDLPTVFPWNYEPKNYNGKFSGKMTITTALNASRNIPAIKAYFLAGEQKEIIAMLKNFWVESLNPDFYYGAPLALGSGEMKATELAQAYSVFANMWNKVEVNPILKILDGRWLVIEEKRPSTPEKVLDDRVAFLVNSIMSNSASRDASWNTNLTLRNRVSAAKTGTSNKVFVGRNGQNELFPWDLWTAWYTPTYTTVVWAWNTNWKAIAKNWDGLNGAAPIWKNFMEFAHTNIPNADWKRPANLSSVKISKISWLLAPEWFDQSFVIDGLFKNPPKQYDNSFKEIEVDMYCNGKVTPQTPQAAIRKWFYIALNSIDTNNAVRQESVNKWVAEWWAAQEFWNIPNIITNYKDVPCERTQNMINSSNIQISSNIPEWAQLITGYNHIEISYRSTNPLVAIQILIGENMVANIPIAVEKSWTYKGTFEIPAGYDQDHVLTIRWVDAIYYSQSEQKNIVIWGKDKTPPEIILTNPTNNKIAIYEDQFFNLRWVVQDTSSIKSTNIYIDNNPYVIGLQWREFIQEINRSIPIPVGSYTLKIESVDFYFNTGIKEISLEVLAR